MKIRGTFQTVGPSSNLNTKVDLHKVKTMGSVKKRGSVSLEERDSLSVKNQNVTTETQKITDVAKGIKIPLENLMPKVKDRIFNNKLQFFVDKSTDRFVIKVVNKDTEKVIMQIPREVQLKLFKFIKELIELNEDKDYGKEYPNREKEYINNVNRPTVYSQRYVKELGGQRINEKV